MIQPFGLLPGTMRIQITIMLIMQLFCFHAYAAEDLQQVKIIEPYIDLHQGPGGGYPILQVIERGTFITIVSRRADWFEVHAEKNIEGWVHLEQLKKTLSASGEALEFAAVSQSDFIDRNWEWGVMGGDFGGAPSLTVYAAYLFNAGFAVESGLSQSIGDVSSSLLFKLGLVMQPFPEWRVSPFLQLATGVIDVKPSSTTIQPIDRTNQFSNISLGVRTYLTKKIIFRLEYNQYIVFSSTIDNDNNEDIKEWKAGFAVFF